MKNIFTRSLCCLIFSIHLLHGNSQPVVVYNDFITSGLSSPIEIVNAGDGSGRLFIVQQGGTIMVWVSGSAVLATPFLTIPGSTFASGAEQGLLSMAFHPDYATNGFFYVYYTRSDRALIVARYHATPGSNTADPGGTELIAIPHPFDNHNGGHLQFRTEAGIHYLYFATGDGGSADDPGNNSQNDASMLGKMIRMNVDLALPITPEVFAKGLRNPFRWSFDRATGDIWIGDVGQGLREEVDFWPAASGAGANFGWRCFEGTIQNTNVSLCDPPGKIPPVFEYNNPNGASSPSSAVTGGYVYHGSSNALDGYYIATDFYSGQLWVLNPDGSVASTQTNLVANIAAFGEAQNGELYAASITGNVVYRISATGSSTLPITLLNFSAKQFSGYNELRWSTSFEQNASKYIVEYSTDGSNFSIAGEVAATNNPSGSSYTYLHMISDTRKLFYRLQMHDLDGSSRLSPIITVGGKGTSDIKVYPTILQNNLLNIIANTPVERISVFDLNGKQLYTNALNGRQGYFSIQLPNMAAGLYLVSLRGADYNKTERIIIQ